MDDYSIDENHLKHNSQTPGNSKKIKKVRKQKSSNDQLTKSTEQPNIKSKRKVKKLSNHQLSADKISDFSSEPVAIDITNSMSTDQNSFTKYHGHRPSTSESFQINDSDLQTESSFSSDLSQKIPGKLTKKDLSENQKRAIRSVKPAESSQVSYSDLQTESNFSSDLSQKIPGKMTKKDLSENQKRVIRNVKPVESSSDNIDVQVSISDDYSYTSQGSQKQANKPKGKKKMVKKRLSSSQNNSESASNRKSNISTDSAKGKIQKPQDFLMKQPRRREYFDRADIDDGKRKTTKIISNPSTDQNFSDDYSLSDNQNIKSRNMKVEDEDSMFTINSSSLLSTNSEINYKDEIDISQTPLPNEESFKKLQNNAILSIKSTNPHEKSKSITLSDEIPTDLETTTTNGLTESNLSQVQKADFKEEASKAIREVKEVSTDDLSFDSHSLEFTDEIKKEDNNSNETSETKSISDPKLNSKFNLDIQERKSNDENSLYSGSIEEEEEEDDNVAVDSLTQSQLNQTVDILSDNVDVSQNHNISQPRNVVQKTSHVKEDSDVHDNLDVQNGQLNSSDQFFNSEVTDDQALRVVKSKVDDLVIPESTKAYMNKGIRMRPKQDDTGAAYGQLSLPEKNDELQFDSEISELDVEIDTDKKKFKKSIVSKTPTNRIPSSIPSVDRRRNKKNKYGDDNNQKSRNNFNEPSNIEYSDFPSFLSSDPSEVISTRDINIDGMELIQEDSMMYPTQFDVQQANSDDEGSLFERFKRNANLLSSSSSDEQNPPSLPTKTRSTPNDSVTEVVENTYTEIDSISGSSGNSKRHKDKTVTKGKITLYNLSSSSSFDDLDDDLDLDMQERGIKNEFSIDNDLNDDNNINKQRGERIPSRPTSTKTQNCYFDGNVVLKLTVVEAKDLPQEEFTPLDPYCTVALTDKKKIQKTKTIRSTTKPIWDQQFIFNYNIHKLTTRTNPPSTPIFRNSSKQNGIFLYIQVINEDKFGGDREISSAQLDLKDVKISQYIDQWIKLKPSGNFRTGGAIRLNLFVEPQTPISTFSPRKTKINNNDDSDYLLSPRSQTPSAQYTPFGESTKRRQTTNATKTYFNSNSAKKPQEEAKVSQTPNINYSKRPWTDSGSSEVSTIETQNPKEQNEAATFTLADNIDEEEEEEEESVAYSDIEEEGQRQIKSNEKEEEEEQNGYHTEIKPVVQQRRSNKNEKFAHDQDLLANQDDPDDLSPIEKTVRDDDDEDGNSLNFNSLPVGEVKRRNVDDFHQEEDENENSYYEDEEEDGDINSQISSLSSGNVDNNLGELDSF